MWNTRYGNFTTEQIIRRVLSNYPETVDDKIDAPLIQLIMDEYFGITTMSDYTKAQENKMCPSFETIRRHRMKIWKLA